MNNKAVTLSLLMAVVAVMFVQSYVTSIEESARKKYGSKVVVLVAKDDVKEMTTLDETMIGRRVIPKRFLEPAAIAFNGQDPSSNEITKDLKTLSGSVAVVPLKKGEQITYNKITEPGLRTGLSPQITPGKRAVTIKVDDQSGVGKLIKPGDRVDLVVAFEMSQRRVLVKTLLQDVPILAVGKFVANNIPRIEKDNGRRVRVTSLAASGDFNTVTIEVDPREAQEVIYVASGGAKTFLSLRNSDDSERVQLSGQTVDDLLGSDRAKVPERKPAARRPARKRR